MKNIKIILAESLNGVIGLRHPGERKNYLPWRLKGDMSQFREKTTRGAVVMGRTTWDTIPDNFRPLKGRQNIVLSSSADAEFSGAQKMSSVEEVLAFAEANSDITVWIIGGTKTYQAFIEHAEEIHLTCVHAEVHEEGSVLGPDFSFDKHGTPSKFYFAHEQVHEADENNDYGFTVKVFKKTLSVDDIRWLQKWAKKKLASHAEHGVTAPYEDLMKKILFKGVPKTDRTGTGTISLFGEQIRFNLGKAFPLVTTKKIHTKSVIYELLWFLAGDTNIQYLCKNGIRIWDDWPYEKYRRSAEFQGENIKEFAERIVADDEFAKKWGDLGPVYGRQWRGWEGPDGMVVDQIANVIEQIKKNPDSRRLIVSAWNVSLVENMALPPCHTMFQFYVSDGKLSCQLYQRSADVFLGVPFNIASYALLTMMIAQVCELKLGEFVHTFGDLHLYANHLGQVVTQLSRTPYAGPQMEINPEVKNIFGFTFDDFKLRDYNCHPAIDAPVAV